MNSPAIRFAGFTDAWEQRKFGEMYRKVNEKNDMTFGLDRVISVANMYFKRDGYVTDLEYLKTYNVFKLGDIAFEGNRSKNFAHGRFVENTIGDGIVSHVFIVFRPTMKFDLWFWKYAINNERLMGAVLTRSTKSSTMMTDLVVDDFLKNYFLVPCFDEQREIGKFFVELDRLITLHQREHDKTVNIKNALLEKMFPKDGEDKPEIRFAGFTDAWEQRKLGDVYSKIRNAFVGTATPYYVKEGHFYLESNNVKDGQINRNTEIFINDEFYERQKDNWLRTGDLVMVQSGHVGHTAIIPPELDNTAAHALIIIANPIQQINPYFLNYQFQTRQSRKKLSNITTGNTIKHILSSEIKKFCMELPCYDEQMHIGHIFINLDRLIALHKRELTKLQNIKKALLEKMFV